MRVVDWTWELFLFVILKWNTAALTQEALFLTYTKAPSAPHRCVSVAAMCFCSYLKAVVTCGTVCSEVSLRPIQLFWPTVTVSTTVSDGISIVVLLSNTYRNSVSSPTSLLLYYKQYSLTWKRRRRRRKRGGLEGGGTLCFTWPCRPMFLHKEQGRFNYWQ